MGARRVLERKHFVQVDDEAAVLGQLRDVLELLAVGALGEHRLRLPDALLEERRALPAFEEKRLILGVRPEDLDDASVIGGAAEGGWLDAIVDIREDLGSEILVHFGVGAPPVRGEDVAAAIGAEALDATAMQARERGSLFVARVDRESRAREGEPVRLAVNTRRLHFFDPATGRGIYGRDND